MNIIIGVVAIVVVVVIVVIFVATILEEWNTRDDI